MLRYNTGSLYGFEDYKTVNLPPYLIDGKPHGYYGLMHSLENGFHVINNNYVNNTQGYIEFANPIQENKELLKTAKKLYIHPDCDISRALVATKYSKCLNAWLSDAVIIPTPTVKDLWIAKYALFINENKKVIFKIHVWDDQIAVRLARVPLGVSLKSLTTGDISNLFEGQNTYTEQDFVDAELFVWDELILIPNNKHHLVDVFNNTLPLDKIVFQESLQEALGDESNKLDINNILSIKDMMESSDSDTVTAGIKALSMLDYMKYRNSIIYMIKWLDNSRWKWSEALSFTSVKFMFKQLFGDNWRWVIKRNASSYMHDIDEDDYKLFKQLTCKFEGVTESNVDVIVRSMPFVTISEGLMVPILKKGA